MGSKSGMFKISVLLSLITLITAGFKEDCLKAHNKYRAKHSAPPMRIDGNLQNIAQNYANHQAKNKIRGHSGRPGENLFWYGGRTSVNGAEPVDGWYNEIREYDWNNPGFASGTGHFTQVVWVGSTKLGCAYASDGKDVFVVANYDPPGNFQGRFRQNVMKNNK